MPAPLVAVLDLDCMTPATAIHALLPHQQTGDSGVALQPAGQAVHVRGPAAAQHQEAVHDAPPSWDIGDVLCWLATPAPPTTSIAVPPWIAAPPATQFPCRIAPVTAAPTEDEAALLLGFCVGRTHLDACASVRLWHLGTNRHFRVRHLPLGVRIGRSVDVDPGRTARCLPAAHGSEPIKALLQSQIATMLDNSQAQ